MGEGKKRRVKTKGMDEGDERPIFKASVNQRQCKAGAFEGFVKGLAEDHLHGSWHRTRIREHHVPGESSIQ